MRRLIYLDQQFLQSFGARKEIQYDNEIVNKVGDALKSIDPQLQDIIRERFFENLSIAEISERNGIDEKEIIKLVYEGKRQLKMLLADFVNQRWGIKANGICKVCVHPKEKIINNILLSKNRKSSWTIVIRQIDKAVGEKFTPPQILKAHLNHIKENTQKGNKYV